MFSSIKQKVKAQFDRMAKHDLFVVDLEKDELFDAYLQALPDDERQSHTCNACRSFLNHYGGIVSLQEGKIQTLWDFEEKTKPYSSVPAALREIVTSKVIVRPFLSTFDKLGIDSNRQQLENGEVIRWEHFFVQLPRDKVVRGSKSIESIIGAHRATKDVFQRSLETITIDAVETVLDLIAQNALYRGKEFEARVKNFLKHQIAFGKLKKKSSKSIYIWSNYSDGGRVRNSEIGTLLVNLSEGMPIESAVRAFEAMVAPANYKRPTSIVTEKMVERAQQQIEELGLTSALQRRHARAEDIPVTNLLFVNRRITAAVGSAFDELKSGLTVSPKNVKAKEVSIDEFVQSIQPKASSVELLLEGSHNFMSLIAPVDEDADSMFQWSNSISWTYQNNLTDAIKEKVKKAGGSVDGELRISLEWFNYDDLDLHVIEPGGCEISFRNRRSARGDGFLDVDMNAGGGTSREPVENIAYAHRIPSGTYRVVVHNFSKRENIDLGFNVQVECKSQGTLINLNYAKAVHNHEQIEVATFKYSSKEGITDFKSSLDQSHSSREVNGLFTNKFQNVRMAMWSPNHWKDEVGNKHIFFILDGAYIDNALRPFFNEYLKSSLYEHRKVFEILGSKLMVKADDEQLSGVGFSLTQRHSFVVKVNNVVYRVTT